MQSSVNANWGQDRSCGVENINVQWKTDFVQLGLLSILLSKNSSFAIKDYRFLYNYNETSENMCFFK